MLLKIAQIHRAVRVICVFCALCILWFVSQALYESGIELFFCIIHKLTGLHCPGCGAMRAFSSLLHLEFREAFGYNAIFIFALPILAALLVRMTYTYIQEGSALKPLKWDIPIAVIISVVVTVFAIMRNMEAFRFLAPK